MNLLILSSRMFWFKLKRIINACSKNLRTEKTLLLEQPRKLNSSDRNKLSLKIRSLSLIDNAKKANLNIKSFATPYKVVQTRTKTWLENLKILKPLWDQVKTSLNNRHLKDRIWEKSTCNVLMRIKSWIVRLINAF